MREQNADTVARGQRKIGEKSQLFLRRAASILSEGCIIGG